MLDLAIELEKTIKQIPIEVDKLQQEKLIILIQQLIKWNKTYNLTAITEAKEILIKHILDSIIVSPYLQGNSFVDIGTGPGFPGLPLAIINPDKNFLLVDCVNKKINFVKHMIRTLELTNVQALKIRVEDFKADILFEGIISRAFASIDLMLNLTDHLLAKNGAFYALKGKKNETELDSIGNSHIIKNIYPLLVPELNAERNLIILTKK